jgi:hypothetical protein
MSLQRLTVIFGAVVLGLLATTASAPADLSLDVSPAKYEFQLAGGKNTTIPILVRNNGSASVHIQVSLGDFLVERDGNYKFLPLGKGPYSMGNWIDVNPREFDLEPQAFKQVRFTVNVPGGASGEYSGLVFFTTRPPRKPGGLAIAERVASKLYEIVPDTAKFAGEIDDVVVKPDASGEKYLVGFHNTGNAHVYLSGRVEIKSGSQVIDRVVLPKDMLVERNGSRMIEAVGKKLAAGSYSAIAFIDYGGPNLIAGQTSFVVR